MGIPPRPGGALKKTLGRYEFICEISRSYLGPLWAARTGSGEGEGLPASVRRLGTATVAPETIDQICEAAWWAMEVEHERAARVLDVVVSENEIGVVTDYMEGEPLRALARQAGLKRAPISQELALRITKDLLRALEAIRVAGEDLSEEEPYVFGGVSPDSVFIGTDGETRVIDVGVAAIASTMDAFAKHPDRAAYVAPERLDGEGPADARSDMFSVGVMMWEMLSSRRLFVGANFDAVAQKVKSGPIQRLDKMRTHGAKHVSESVAEIVAKALDRDPYARFESFGEMLAAIDGSGEQLASVGDTADLVNKLAGYSLGPRRKAVEKATADDEPLSNRFKSKRPPKGSKPEIVAVTNVGPVDVVSPPPPAATPSPAPADAASPKAPDAAPKTPSPAAPPVSEEHETEPKPAEAAPGPVPAVGDTKQTIQGMPSPAEPPPKPAAPPPKPAAPPPKPAKAEPPPAKPAPPDKPKKTMLGMGGEQPGFKKDEPGTQPSVRDIPVSKIEPPSEFPPPSEDAEPISLDPISIRDSVPVDSDDAITLRPAPMADKGVEPITLKKVPGAENAKAEEDGDVPPPPGFLPTEPGTLPSADDADVPKKEVDAWVKALTTPLDEEEGASAGEEPKPAIPMPVPQDRPSVPEGAPPKAATDEPSSPSAAEQSAPEASPAPAIDTSDDDDDAPVVPERTQKLRKIVAAVVGGLALLAIAGIVLGGSKSSSSEDETTTPSAAPSPKPKPAPAAPASAPPAETAASASDAEAKQEEDAGAKEEDAGAKEAEEDAGAAEEEPAAPKPVSRPRPIRRKPPRRPKPKFDPDDI